MSNDLQYPTIEQVQQKTKLQDRGVIEAFIETLKWLDEKAPPKFDGLPGKYRFNITTIVMQERLGDSNEPNSCGTVCCIAGAAMLYQAKGVFEVADEMLIGDYTDIDDELGKLFFPTTGFPHTPLRASRALRHYLYTGRVSWSAKAGTRYNVEAITKS